LLTHEEGGRTAPLNAERLINPEDPTLILGVLQISWSYYKKMLGQDYETGEKSTSSPVLITRESVKK
jgi:hypothetical protein